MKTFLLFIGFLTACCLPAWTSPVLESTDTIYVSTTLNSYVVMDEPVAIVDLGTAADYGARIENNVVFLKALKPDAPLTTLFISAGNKVFAGIISYKKENQRFLYDLREKTLNAAATFNREHYVPETDIRLIRDRLFSLGAENLQAQEVSNTRNGIRWSLVDVKTDPSAIYLRLRLENQTALVYRIESISVENAEHYRKRILSRKKVTLLPVKPLIEGNISDVKPYASHDFYLALPSYAVGRQGSVLVTIRESTGVRAMQLEIPPQLMDKADLF